MKIALAQINPTVGDFTGNSAKIVEYTGRAQRAGAALVAFPELCICGYPPRDLVERRTFVERGLRAAEEIARQTRGLDVVCGLVTPAPAGAGKTVMNSAVLLRDGAVAFTQSKRLLPTYDVFDEARNFAPAESQRLVCAAGLPLALTICEDVWNDKAFWDRRLYGVDPVEELVKAGAGILLNISASPFCLGKPELRHEMLAAIARRHHCTVAMVNQVGGNDSLVFDGSSIVLSPDGNVIAQAASFAEDLICFDTETLAGDLHPQSSGEEASAYAALVLGTRDYVRKCAFSKAIVGLSGGIDSALTVTIAAEALGAENVIGVAMPSQYSSEGSVNDARAIAANLGVRFEIVPIEKIFEGFRRELKAVFAGTSEDVTEENIQARVRGTILMALSNKFRALVLATGNKSEIGVGYCTLYGDMAGGLAVISDVPKTLVYRICRYLNRERRVIPESTLTKPPSAELRPGQKDSDSLPDYELLDPILADYVEELKSPEEIARDRGFDLALVRSVTAMIDRNEYKRQQAAPGIKISEKAFGIGRRLPIAARSEV